MMVKPVHESRIIVRLRTRACREARPSLRRARGREKQHVSWASMLDVSERERRHSHTATFQTRNPGEAVLLLVVIILLLCLSLFYLFLCVSGEARSSTGVKAPGPARRGTARKPCLGRPPRRDASHEGRPRARAQRPRSYLGRRQMGSTLMGPLQK